MTYSLLKEFANEHKQNPTEAECILWNQLKGGFFGCHFRRQHIIGSFIADIVCLKKKLIIEIDGGYHQLPDNKQATKNGRNGLRTKALKY